MGFKFIIISFLIINFYLLQDLSQKYSFKPPALKYFNTRPWQTYISLFNFKSLHYGIITDTFYCEKVKNLGHAKIENIFDRVVFSDYIPSNLVKEVLSANGRLVLADNHILSDDNVKHQYLDESINLFFHKSDWHNNQMIGSSFLCDHQRYNHIPGNIHLVYKDLFAFHAAEYSKLTYLACFDLNKFLPKTYDLSIRQQCEEIFELLNDSEGVNWIKKKSRNSHNAEGIEILDRPAIFQLQQEMKNGKNCGKFNSEFIIQKYIQNPLIINGKKFDFRVYMLIANLDPLVVLYHDGFLRFALNEYDLMSNDPSRHITNTALALSFVDKFEESTFLDKENELEKQMWTFQQLENFLVSTKKVPENWINNYLIPQMKEKMFHIVRMIYHELLAHQGVFELFGMDFLLDEDLNLWFLEANKSPAMMATTEAKGNIQKGMIKEVMDIEYGLLNNEEIEDLVLNTKFQFIFNGFHHENPVFSKDLQKKCMV